MARGLMAWIARRSRRGQTVHKLFDAGHVAGPMRQRGRPTATNTKIAMPRNSAANFRIMPLPQLHVDAVTTVSNNAGGGTNGGTVYQLSRAPRPPARRYPR
jgi:hypothetical protein